MPLAKIKSMSSSNLHLGATDPLSCRQIKWTTVRWSDDNIAILQSASFYECPTFQTFILFEGNLYPLSFLD